MLRTFILALALLAVGWSGAQADSSDCKLLRIASLPLSLDSEGGATVPISIGGHDFDFLIDTGGIISMLSEDSVKTLGLSELSIFQSEITMFGGKRVNHYVVAHDIVLGGLKAPRFQMLVLPPGFVPDTEGGTIAPDILRSYDDEFDFAHAKFNLFSKDHCEGNVVYWTSDPYATVKIEIDNVGHIVVPIEVDGKEIRADIDTGSSRSFMSLETARRLFDLPENDPNVKPVPGDGGKDFTYPFESLTLKDVAVKNPDILLIPDDVSKWGMGGYSHVTLGMGILRQLHIYIAYGERTLYATPASAH